MTRAQLTEKILDIKRANDWSWKHIHEAVGEQAEARLHRDGDAPIVGIAAIEKGTSGRTAFRTTPAGGGVARSGDLGYTYGSYAVGSGEKGWYARVWAMTEAGDWKVAVQIEKPASKDK